MDNFFSSLFAELKKNEEKYLAFILGLIKRDAVQDSTVYLNEEDYKKFGQKVKIISTGNLKVKCYTIQFVCEYKRWLYYKGCKL